LTGTLIIIKYSKLIDVFHNLRVLSTAAGKLRTRLLQNPSPRYIYLHGQVLAAEIVYSEGAIFTRRHFQKGIDGFTVFLIMRDNKTLGLAKLVLVGGLESYIDQGSVRETENMGEGWTNSR
jgi:hypothetical protein